MLKQLFQKNKKRTKVKMTLIEVNDYKCYGELSGLASIIRLFKLSKTWIMFLNIEQDILLP